MQGRLAVNFLIGSVLIALSGAVFAKLEVRTSEQPLGTLRYAVVSEEITSGDIENLRRGLDEHSGNYFRNVVVLNSPGGSVDEAMKIGRLIRSLGFGVIVPREAVCFSSCVYILAAGVDKTVAGAIGIHRPYFDGGHSPTLAASLKEVESRSAQYFDEMNIPVTLTEVMFTTPPNEMRILTPVELGQYRLNMTDYVTAEKRSLLAMEILGWTRNQYEAFLAEIDYRCSIYTGSPSKMMPCMREIATKHQAPQALIDTFQ